MADLSTKYMGLTLKNPVIVASSHLTSTSGKIAECEKAGAGAVVLKSLFEEQIRLDMEGMLNGASDMGRGDGWDFLNHMSKSHVLEEYLNLLEEAKKKTTIPLIASVNCTSAGEWVAYAKKLESAGADALELNSFVIPSDVKKDADYYEKIYLDILAAVKSQVKIPVSMKISPHFTDLARMIKRLADQKLDGLVLFNRFYRPDVDIDKLEIKHAPVMSSPSEIYMTLQWIALLAGEINMDFCGATGIFDAQGIIKQLLVGAKAVQICSAFIKDGLEIIPGLLKGVENWMTEKGFAAVPDFCCKLCQENSSNPEIYERAQYIKGVVGIS